MTTVQQYCLRWNNHQPNFISVFSSLLLNETLVDVTLAAEGRQLQAHKVVLSACSSYFQSLFTTNPCKHPIVILKDVQYNDLKTMVDFMYYGEVNVSTEQLPQILKTAEMLKIKGLAEMPDAASVTKSDSKSSDHTDGNQSISGVESMWGSTESQQQAQQQQYHTIRRTPSPSNMSPATRRKRLRKTSTGSGSINISASIERIQDDHQQIQHQQQATIDGRMMQKYSQQQSVDVPLSTFSAVSQTGAIANVRGMKINSSPENQMQHQQDQHEHIDESQHITEMKTEDLSCVNQSMPLDISTGTSTTPVSCPPTQQHSAQQSELLFTSCSSISSPSSPISLSLSSPAIITATTNVVVGANSSNNNNNNTSSNLSAASKRGRLLIRQQRIKKDGDQTGDLETPEAGIYQEYLLSVPSSGARMERHASEPSPASSGLITTSSSSSASGNLLSVPTHTSYLIKQHSHPLLPSQSSSPSTSYTLTRQLSHPIQTISHQTSQVVSTVTSHGGHDAGSSGQLLQMHHHKSAPVRSQTLPHYTVTDMDFSSGNDKAQTSSNMSNSPTVVIIPDVSSDQTTTVVQSHIPSQHTLYQKSSSHHLQLPSIRVKSEELQRSISSPLASTRSELSFETTTRSSHCPTLRAGPALGCNFCWNTIDAHGRILRRKTKYHCPECQTNLCIVPCFQEYHERQSNEGSNETSSTKSSGLKSLKTSQTM